MPTAPLHPCPYPGCHQLVASGLCPAHTEVEVDSAQLRQLYQTPRWRRERRAFLALHPICECADCVRDGIVIAAKVVDHKIPFRNENEFWIQSNWQALCKPHHDRKTATETNAKRQRWAAHYR
jgi:5-methylcytosine-specific restriction protein A